MHKKNILLTGVTGAIGKATLIQLVKAEGLNLILAGRNESSLSALKASIIESASAIDILRLDMADFKSVYNFIDLIKSRYQRLDVIVNIAAVIKRQRTITVDGLEVMFQTNFLSPFLLTTRLCTSDPARATRVITVSSASTSVIDFQNLNSERKFSTLNTFSQSKSCNVLFVKMLARKFANQGGNISIGFDPGITL
jgi:NAD(P)-dependent dehydrogenase (short-subunit alcohol dehydrogenase family)